MKKLILIDGNNLLFRSYYATAYTGNFMRNSEGFPTNGIYGLVNMLNKIINEEKPEYIAVAFDVGKTFRHEKYADYKAGRSETPDELKMQFPVAKKIIEAMGIKYIEKEGYEADDIIGTLAKKAYIDKDFIATIISSDKDLLQLINEEIDVKLLKTKDYIKMNKQTFFETYKIEPIKMIDLKALMGDSSDNIKGVKGIGEKTALKLLQKYGSLDNIYNNIEEITGSTKTKLIDGKNSAYESYELATIYTDVDLDIELEDLKINKENTSNLIEIYNDLEFYSLLKNTKNTTNDLEFKIINSIDQINITNPVAIYLELDKENYHYANIVGMGVYNQEVSYYIPKDILYQNPSFLTDISKYTYDYKKIYVSFLYNNIKLDKIDFDLMLSAYLLNYNVKEDIEPLAMQFNVNFSDDLEKNCVLKAKFIFDNKEQIEKKLKEEEVYDFYKNIEFPLSRVLGDMEYTGVNVDKNTLIKMGDEIKEKLESLTKEIYNQAGSEFNISSPKELGVILFEKLELPHGKKNSLGYSTNADILNKLKDKHPIINLILEYRMLTKLYSTYIEGLMNYIGSDNKIHTIFTQTLTRTGRLSSTEPNLQNIPVRYEYGKLIRKAFVPSEDSVLLSSDYSQIELRIFTHMANVETLVEAIKNGLDIHTKTAMDIFHVSKEDVTSNMRRIAKAVNFGILYGISSFGLAENIHTSVGEAKAFIDHYFEAYPGIKSYMDEVVKEAYKNGYVKTLLNRKRTINELKSNNKMIRNQGERMALNTPIQGTSADIIKKAMNEVKLAFEENNLKSKLILQVHDELIIDCKKDELELVTKLLKDIMENTIKLRVPLEVDIHYGDNWYDAK